MNMINHNCQVSRSQVVIHSTRCVSNHYFGILTTNEENEYFKDEKSPPPPTMKNWEYGIYPLVEVGGSQWVWCASSKPLLMIPQSLNAQACLQNIKPLANIVPVKPKHASLHITLQEHEFPLVITNTMAHTHTYEPLHICWFHLISHPPSPPPASPRSNFSICTSSSSTPIGVYKSAWQGTPLQPSLSFFSYSHGNTKLHT